MLKKMNEVVNEFPTPMEVVVEAQTKMAAEVSIDAHQWCLKFYHVEGVPPVAFEFIGVGLDKLQVLRKLHVEVDFLGNQLFNQMMHLFPNITDVFLIHPSQCFYCLRLFLFCVDYVAYEKHMKIDGFQHQSLNDEQDLGTNEGDQSNWSKLSHGK